VEELETEAPTTSHIESSSSTSSKKFHRFDGWKIYYREDESEDDKDLEVIKKVKRPTLPHQMEDRDESENASSDED